jgi:glycopeptide antibiotics resistance protein
MSHSLRCNPYRLALLIGMVSIIPFGYCVRFSTQLHAPLLQDIVGSVAYQILLMMVVAFISPRLSLVKNAIGVFIVSSAIEFQQLCQLPFLVAVRATWVGRVILGNTFLWSDFPPYALGCLLGWIILRTLRQKHASRLPQEK